MSSLLIYALIGGSLGAVLGYRGQCGSGARSLLSNWRHGALYGAVAAVLFCLIAGCGFDSKTMNQSTANVKHITDADFNAEVTQSSLPVVADFYATWCGPCRRLAPIMDALAEQYAGKIKFVKINVDESPQLAQQFRAEAIPMLVFFKQGESTGKLVGLQSKDNLIKQLDSMLTASLQPATPGR